MDRLQIEITGDLPEKGKYGIIDAAEKAIAAFVDTFTSEHAPLTLNATVRSVRPGKPKIARPAVRAVSEAAE